MYEAKRLTLEKSSTANSKSCVFSNAGGVGEGQSQREDEQEEKKAGKRDGKRDKDDQGEDSRRNWSKITLLSGSVQAKTCWSG